MEIMIDGYDVKLGSSGMITGPICFKIEDKYFPESNWNDFIVVILGWWINNFTNAIKYDLGKFEFCFMDGPYLLTGVLKKNGIYEIQMIEQRGDENELEIKAYVTKKEIKDMLLKTCRKLFRALVLAGIPSDKYIGLKKLFNELKVLKI